MKENYEPNNSNTDESSLASHSSASGNSDDQWYDSEWLTVIQKIEKDNAACEMYINTIKWLDERYTLTPKN
jgi:hypothetical protein